MGSVVFWLIIAIAVFALDILTSNFFFVLFSIGAIAASIGAGMEMAFIIQIIIFAVVSIISFMIGYPWLKKNYKKMHKKTLRMEETYIGKIMEASNQINDKAQIKVNGEYWTAINSGETIYPGDKFEIIGIEGIKLKIKKV